MAVDADITPNRTTLNLVSVTGEGAGTTNTAALTVTDLESIDDLVFGLFGDLTGTGTLDVIIQDSYDGTNWDDWITFTQRTGDGCEHLSPSRAPAPFIRVQRTVGGAGTWDIEVNFAGRATLVS